MFIFSKNVILKNSIVALFSGIIMALTITPFNLFFLSWIALIPLWIIIRKSSKLFYFYAFLWGCGYHGLALFWITGIHPMTWMRVPYFSSLLITIFVWVFITLWGTAIVVFWSFVVKKLSILKNNYYSNFIQQLLTIIFAVSLWCILENIWSHTPLWWTTLSLTQSPNNLNILELLQFSGTTTITALIVSINLFLAEGLLNLFTYYQSNKNININQYFYQFRLGLIGLILLIITHVFGYFIYQQEIVKPLEKEIKIGIIQGNIPNEIKFHPEGWRNALERYTQGYQILAKQNVDVILTPETALPFYYDQIKENSSFYQAILKEKIPVFLGAFDQKNNAFTNTLFLLNNEGNIISKYDKVNLVPLGEYIPFSSILGNFIKRLSPLDAQLIAGEKNQIFNTPFGQAIIGICYDSAFPEHFRRQTASGGRFIITASNNAHYSDSMASQHHAQDVMRAIETNRWMATATNTGYSSIINPRGDTIWISNINKYQIKKGIIYQRDTKTLYVKWGDWLVKIFTLYTLIYLIFLRIKELENKRK